MHAVPELTGFKNLLIYYDIFMTSAQELLFDRRSKEF